MILKLAAPCYCADKIAGVLKRLIVATDYKQVLAIVIERDFPKGLEVALPIEKIAASREDITELSVTLQHLAKLDGYTTTRSLDDESDTKGVPKVELSRKSRLMCVDGEVGIPRVFVIDQATFTITRILFDCGLTLGREVSVPVNLVKEFESDAIHLQLERNALRDLPARHF
jgi:hypothetical protein